MNSELSNKKATQLAMHSCYETAGVKDAIALVDAMKAYYGSTLAVPQDGTYVMLNA